MSLVDLAQLPAHRSTPQLSPDGKLVVYVLSAHRLESGPAGVSSLAPGRWRRRAGAADVQRRRRPAGALRWSPDGKTLLFLRDGQICAAAGRRRRAARADEARDRRRAAPTWSPDGTAVYFLAATRRPPTSASATGCATMCSLFDEKLQAAPALEDRRRDRRRDAGHDRRLRRSTTTACRADGKRIARAARAVAGRQATPYRGEVWVMDANGENPRVAHQQRDRRDRAPNCRPTTRRCCSSPTRTSASSRTTRPTCSSCPPPAATPRLARARLPVRDRSGGLDAGRQAIIAVVNMGVHSEFFRIDVAAGGAQQLTDGAHFIPSGMERWCSSRGQMVFQIDEPTRFGDVWTLPLGAAPATPTRVTRQFDTLDATSRFRGRRRSSGKAPTARRSRAALLSGRLSCRAALSAGRAVARRPDGVRQVRRSAPGSIAELRAGADRQGLRRAAAELSRQRRLRRRVRTATSSTTTSTRWRPTCCAASTR